MAKLNGVTTVDMENGEITKVSYNGAEYSKVDGEVKVGDIGLRVKRGTSWATIGEYYPTVSDTEYADDVGHEPYFIREHFVFFRNAKPAPSIESLDKRVTALEEAKQSDKPTTVKRHAKVGERILITEDSSMGSQTYKLNDVLTVIKADVCSKGDVNVEGQTSFVDYREYEVIVDPTLSKPEISKAPADLITHNGADYSLVQRKAQAGDVVVFTANKNRFFTNGKAYGPVSSGDTEIVAEDNEGDNLSVYNGLFNRTEATVLVYEKVADAYDKFPEGAKVRLLSGGGVFPLIGKRNGLVYTVSDNNVYRDVKRRIDIGDAYALPHQIELVAEEAPKPARIKSGDVVRVTKYVGNSAPIGSIGIAEFGHGFGIPCMGMRDFKGRLHSFSGGEGLELIASVESRVDVK